jgi:hypothetical protein
VPLRKLQEPSETLLILSVNERVEARQAALKRFQLPCAELMGSPFATRAVTSLWILVFMCY